MKNVELKVCLKRFEAEVSSINSSVYHYKEYDGRSKYVRCKNLHDDEYDKMMDKLENDFKFKDTWNYYAAKTKAICEFFNTMTKTDSFDIQDFHTYLELKKLDHYRETAKFIKRLLDHRKHKRR